MRVGFDTSLSGKEGGKEDWECSRRSVVIPDCAAITAVAATVLGKSSSPFRARIAIVWCERAGKKAMETSRDSGSECCHAYFTGDANDPIGIVSLDAHTNSLPSLFSFS